MSKKMKHVERNLFWVKEEIMKKTFSLVWVETSNQIADLFTKALVPLVFWRFVDMLMISSSREYREMCKIEGYHQSRISSFRIDLAVYAIVSIVMG